MIFSINLERERFMIFTILVSERLMPGQKYTGKIPPPQPKRVQAIFNMMETNAYLRPPLGMSIIFPAKPDFPRRDHDGGNFEFHPNLFLHITPVYDGGNKAGVEITIRKINYHVEPEDFTPEELRVIEEKLLAISYKGEVISPNQQLLPEFMDVGRFTTTFRLSDLTVQFLDPRSVATTDFSFVVTEKNSN